MENKKEDDALKSSDIKVNNGAIATDGKQEDWLVYENKKQIIKALLLGILIGLAIIVPGVSGAAVCIIFGLYEQLLYAMGNLLRKFKRCFLFLLPIGIGAVIGFALGFLGVKRLINAFPFAVVAAFAGLMVGSFPAITDNISGNKHAPSNKILFFIGFLLPVVVSFVSVFCGFTQKTLDNLTVYHYILFLVLGYLAAITQIVPGLSATALLMMFGYFSTLINAVGFELLHNFAHLFVFLCLGIGFLLGLLTTSKAMSVILERYNKKAFYVITGLSAGAIGTMFFNPEIYQVYSAWEKFGVNAIELVVGIILFMLGAVCSYKLVLKEKNNGKTNNKKT